MLSTKNISCRIGRKQILDDVSIDFFPGEFNMILGPNGSGKSSFLKIFCGEWSHYSGAIKYDGKDLHQIKKQELSKRRAVLSQQPDLDFPLNVEEVVMMGRYPHFSFSPGKKDQEVCDEVMSRMNLDEFKDRNYLTLSGGEKQRVQFARVLAQIWIRPDQGSRYLVLDEPLTSLDIKYQHEFLEIAREFLNHDTTLITIIHDINLAIEYADKLFFFKEGKLVGQGTPGSIVTEELIEKVFSIKARVATNPFTGKPLVL